MKTCPHCETGYPDNQSACPLHGVLLNEIRELRPGMVIHKTYRIVRKLGQGGMGTVYLAQHIQMDEPRALKFLSEELSRDQALTSRFLREVRTLRQVRNINVVDCGDLEAAEDDSLFFSMEFVDGPDLRGLLHNTTGPFPIALALEITRDIARGLGAAHSRGLVHRDIKPENILLAREGNGWIPKIADFGIVATKESSTAYTRTGGTLLTMAYAAPEQWRGTKAADLDGRTDLYALGCVLYEMLAGRTPFDAENYEGWAWQHQNTVPEPASSFRPEVSSWRGLDELVMRLLAKDRQYRPRDVSELLGLINAIQPNAPAQPHRAATVVETKPAPAPTIKSPSVHAAPPPRPPAIKAAPPKSRALIPVVVLISLLLVFCGIAAVSYMARRHTPAAEHQRTYFQAPKPRTIFGSGASVETVAFSPDGRTLAAGNADDAVLWDIASGQMVRTFKGHTAWVYAVAFTPDGRTLATGGVDHDIKLWDVASGKLLRTIPGRSDMIDLSMEGSAAASYDGHSDMVQSLAFSPDGRTLASASSDKTIKLWNPASGKLLRTLRGHSHIVTSVAFSPDGSSLVSASSDHNVMLWDTTSGKLLRTFEGHKDIALCAVFSPDGHTIASSSSDHTVKLWDPASGSLLRTLEGHTGDVRSVAFSPDGRTLASGSDDYSIRLWDVSNGDSLGTMEFPPSGGDTDFHGVQSIAFSPDGHTIASGNSDFTIKLWDLSGMQ